MKFTGNYSKIIQDNLKRLYSKLPSDIDAALPGSKIDNTLVFTAFGKECRVTPDSIFLDSEIEAGVLGILISLYALHVNKEECVTMPLTAFKDIPNTMPYVGAFANNTEGVLIPFVKKIEESQKRIIEKLDGKDASDMFGGDFSFFVSPLPKIKLCYIFYHSDEEFPASATCLFSKNVLSFLPVDAIADVGEYTSKLIISLLL
ncbi:MAG: DUF3786 domain-containing protein [Deltaproteobacteria bacterium]|nr:DUF3786 domain-containing protein [Deltaproteobacteria bacterium]